jgi:hypothetical protein
MTLSVLSFFGEFQLFIAALYNFSCQRYAMKRLAMKQCEITQLTLSPLRGIWTKSMFSSGTGMACDTQNAMVISAIDSFISEVTIYY